MSEQMQCPRCKGNVITYIEDDLLCLRCGNRESLIDYPISAPYFEEPIPQEDFAPNQKKMWDTIQQLKGESRYLRNKLNEHLDKSKKRDSY